MTEKEQRTAKGARAGLVGILSNVVLSVGKIAAGALAASVALIADGLNNLMDAASSIITLIGFKIAEKPADKDHPFGHARMEYICGLAVSFIVLVLGVELFRSSVEKIAAPGDVNYSLLSFGVLIASILVKFLMTLYYRKVGREIDSATLFAAAEDSRNDMIATGAVLCGALVGRFTGFQIDGWLGLGVAIFILISGIKLIIETMSPLLGEPPTAELVAEVEERIKKYPEVLGIHDLVVHDYGPGRRFATVHCEMDYRMDPLQSHEVCDNVERDFAASGIELTVHYDPIVTDDEGVMRLKGVAQAALAEIDKVYTLHDFRIVKGPSFTNLIFDVVLPADFRGDEKEVEAALLEKIRKTEPNVYLVVNFDRSYV